MRKIYLIRHAEPDFPEGKRCFLGSRINLPLSSNGHQHAQRLAECFKYTEISSVWASNLSRSRETAEYLAQGRCDVSICEGIREMDCGIWDGVPFDKIKIDWPELWEKRGKDQSVVPPDGESYADASLRMEQAILSILDKTVGDIVIVSHSGSIRALLCRLTGIPFSFVRTIPQEYACVNVLNYDKNSISVTSVGKAADSFPDDSEVKSLCSEVGTPESIFDHCVAVKDMSVEIAMSLISAGYPVNIDLLSSAALLHDLYRTEHNHAEVCADKMRTLGYIKLASIIETHHGGLCNDVFDESAILFLADKYISGTDRVSIDERFVRSSVKLSTFEAVSAHSKRFAEAKAVEKRFKDILDNHQNKTKKVTNE